MQEDIAALEAIGALLRPHIRARADFLEAARTGKGVTEVDPKGEAAQECETFGWISAAGSGQFKLADERSPEPARMVANDLAAAGDCQFPVVTCPLAGASSVSSAGPFQQFPVAPSASWLFRDQSRA